MMFAYKNLTLIPWKSSLRWTSIPNPFYLIRVKFSAQLSKTFRAVMRFQNFLVFKYFVLNILVGDNGHISPFFFSFDWVEFSIVLVWNYFLEESFRFLAVDDSLSSKYYSWRFLCVPCSATALKNVSKLKCKDKEDLTINRMPWVVDYFLKKFEVYKNFKAFKRKWVKLWEFKETFPNLF